MKITFKKDDNKIVMAMTVAEFSVVVSALESAALADISFKGTMVDKTTEDFTHHRGAKLNEWVRTLREFFGVRYGDGWHRAKGTKVVPTLDPGDGYVWPWESISA